MSHIEKLKMKAKLLVKAKKKSGAVMQLKDALNAVARVAGFSSWRELRGASPEDDEFFYRRTGILLNHWCKTYEEALGVLKEQGGYLLPYKKQYFVVQQDYVEALGISVDDPDLALVGNDWVKPRDLAAFKRLKAKISPSNKA